MKQNLFLQQTYVAIANTLSSPELLTVLQTYSYDEKKMREGLKRYERVKQLTQQRKQAIQVSKSVSETLQEAKERLIVLFQLHLETARLAYKRETSHTDHLDLTRARQRATLELLAQAEEFYANIPAEMMEKYHAPKKELAEAAKLIHRVMELVAMQRQTQGQVQTLTKVRTEALEDLQIWMRKFMTIAEAALDDNPQQMEALNKTVSA